MQQEHAPLSVNGKDARRNTPFGHSMMLKSEIYGSKEPRPV